MRCCNQTGQTTLREVGAPCQLVHTQPTAAYSTRSDSNSRRLAWVAKSRGVRMDFLVPRVDHAFGDFQASGDFHDIRKGLRRGRRQLRTRGRVCSQSSGQHHFDTTYRSRSARTSAAASDGAQTATRYPKSRACNTASTTTTVFPVPAGLPRTNKREVRHVLPSNFV